MSFSEIYYDPIFSVNDQSLMFGAWLPGRPYPSTVPAKQILPAKDAIHNHTWAG